TGATEISSSLYNDLRVYFSRLASAGLAGIKSGGGGYVAIFTARSSLHITVSKDRSGEVVQWWLENVRPSPASYDALARLRYQLEIEMFSDPDSDSAETHYFATIEQAREYARERNVTSDDCTIIDAWAQVTM